MYWRLCFLIVTLCGSAVGAAAHEALSSPPHIMVILDDLGYRKSDLTALSLPKEVTFSILPQTPLSKKIAEKSQQQGRSVMLHMPMQATSGKKMGPLGLTANMLPGAMTQTLRLALKSVPNAIGVNNHMGSALTAEENAMHIVMQELKRQNLFFVDSRTAVNTKATSVAEALGVPYAKRHIFLDNQRSATALLNQFNLAKTYAKRHGAALIIAHPYPETLGFLKQYLPSLHEDGIVLSSVADYLSTNTPHTNVSRAENLLSMEETALPND